MLQPDTNTHPRRTVGAGDAFPPHDTSVSGAAVSGVFPGDLAEISVLKKIGGLLAGYAILMTGNSLLTTLIPLELSAALSAILPDGAAASAVAAPEKHGSVLAVGWIHALYYLGFFIGTLKNGGLIERMGHHRAFTFFAAVAACAVLLYPICRWPVVWALLRLLSGFCLSGIFTVMESWLNAVSSNRYRGQVFSVYLIFTYVGASLGQWLIHLPATPGHATHFSWIALLTVLAILPVTLVNKTIVHASPDPGKTAGDVLWKSLCTIYRNTPLGFVGCLCSGLLTSVFYGLAPVALLHLGYGENEVATVMGLAMLAVLLALWPTALWADRAGRRLTVRIIATVLLGTSLLLACFSPWPAWVLWPLLAIQTAAMFCFYGVLVSYVNDRLPPELCVYASAALLLLFAVGGCLGPLLAGYAMQLAGVSGFYGYIAAIALLLWISSAKPWREPLPAAPQTHQR